ncbi:MAG: response regulator [Pseudomonas sp.]
MTVAENLNARNEELQALNQALEQRLEQQSNRSEVLQTVLHSTGVATLFLDSDLNIRFFTPATQSLFNIIQGDIGRPLADLCSLATAGDLLADATTVMQTLTTLEREVESRTGANLTRRITPYGSHDTRAEGVVITFIDTCDKKQIATALKVAQQKAELATAARSNFLAATSHDLRQPLQTLKLLQGLLLGALKDPQARRLTTRIGETVGAMSGMLNALLDINHIETGKVSAHPVGFRVSDLLDRLADEFNYHAAAKGLKLRVMACHLSIQSDPRLLEQILRNLLSNALKFTHKGRVLLGCRRHGGWLSIEVWDTGSGITAEALEAIFEDYRKPNIPAPERPRGQGLGLTIVQHLSALLGHQLRVKSNPGKGSVFSIDVALSPPARLEQMGPLQNPLMAQEPPVSRKGGMILIVEDEPELLELLGTILRLEGHQVAMALDSDAALDWVAHSGLQPDLILADYNLPRGLNGLQLIMKLRETLHRAIPAIILTGDISRQTSRDVAFQHCTQLNKPAKIKEVNFVIESLLAQSHSELLENTSPMERGPRSAGLPVIFVVDEDDMLRETIRTVLESGDYRVEDYASCEAFLAAYSPSVRACLLVNAQMAGMDGFELLQRLRSQGDDLPAIMISGSSDVSNAVGAMKAGASDFIEKPFSRSDVLHSVAQALEHSRDATTLLAWRQEAADYIAKLTNRQRQIMEMVLAGHPSKNIAADLGISQRTVENHRASIMTRTHSKSIPALARLAVTARACEPLHHPLR